MPTFQMDYDLRIPGTSTGLLSIDTDMLQMVIEGGAIVYIKDKNTSEELIDTSISENFPAFAQNWEFIGFSSMSSGASVISRIPVKVPTYDGIDASFTSTDNVGTLTYNTVYDGTWGQTGCSLEFEITVDATGEVVIEATGTEAVGSGYLPYVIDLPIMNFEGSSIILGKGMKYDRAVSTVQDAVGVGDPKLVLAIGTNSVLATWSECTRHLYSEVIKMWHSPEIDSIINQAVQDLSAGDPQTIVGGPWRIGTYSNWLGAVKRWRVKFEDRTDALPLWNNRAAWVQNVHAMDLTYANGYYSADRLNTLASLVSPEKLFIFAQNDTGIILFGDLQQPLLTAYPNADSMSRILSHGFPLVIYNPWTMVFSETGAATKLATFSVDDLPGGVNFVFQPDYPGTLEDWYDYWLDTDPPSGYVVVPPAYITIHPGSSHGEEYMGQYFPDFCLSREANGVFFDTGGGNDGMGYPATMQVSDLGRTYYQGEVSLMKLLLDASPNYALVTEYLRPEDIGPYVFYTWEGGTGGYTGVTVNHPIRTACIGSYMWTQESLEPGVSGIDLLNAALLGTLPRLSLEGDGGITTAAVEALCTARARLFTTKNLHNDVPTVWNSGAQAYYRSNTGNMFRFEDRGSDVYAYVEEHWQGDYDRLVIDDGVVTTDNIDEELPSILYSRYNYAVLPSDDADLTTIYSTEDIADVAADDTDMVPQLATSQIAVHQFKQQITGTGGIISVVAQVTIPCSTSTTYLQIYNRSGTPAWDTIDSDNATGANTDFPLSATVADLTDYMDENNIVACRVYQEMQ